MNPQRGQNSGGSSDFIPVGGTMRGQTGFQSGTIKGNPSRERAQKRSIFIIHSSYIIIYSYSSFIIDYD